MTLIRMFFILAFFCTASFVYAKNGYTFPQPTGKYGVGSVKIHWTDKSRMDPYSPKHFRELMVQAWYPTASKSFSPNDSAEALYLAQEWRFLVGHMLYEYKHLKEALKYISYAVKSYAQIGASLLQTPEALPVIILSHGLSSLSTLHTTQAENLASHGYVVLGINHTFTSLMSIFPDGNIRWLRFDWENDNVMREFNAVVELWQQDVKFVLDALKNLCIVYDAPENIFYNRLDLGKIGMFGHSMGGATTTQMCRNDARIKAGVNMDGPLFGTHYDQGFKTPYMVMVADGSLCYGKNSLALREMKRLGVSLGIVEDLKKIFRDGVPQLCQNIKDNDGQDAYHVLMKNAGHNTFTDMPLVKDASDLFTCLDSFGLNTGKIEPMVAIESINALLVAFFDKYLQGASAPLLDDPQANPYAGKIVITH